MSAKQQESKNLQTRVTDTVVDIEPSLVGFAIDNEEIQNFVMTYLNKHGIDRLEASRVRIIRAGSRTEAKVYAFISMKSTDVSRNGRKGGGIHHHLQNKIDMGGVRVSDKLRKAVLPLVKGNDVSVRQDNRNNVVYVELDIFRVLGLMLNVNPQFHELNIPKIDELKKGSSVINVIKANRYIERGPRNIDKYSRIVEGR